MYQESSSQASPTVAADPHNVLAQGAGEFPAKTAAASSDSMISPSLEKQIVDIEKRLDSLKGKPAVDLEHDLENYAKGAVESASTALSAAHNSIVYAWATGCVFNLAKAAMGHGSFGRWRDAKTSELGISVRTAQLWMKLAQNCWDVRALLVPGNSLTGAYRATGVLPCPAPAPPGEDDDAEGNDPSPIPDTPSRVEPLFKALTEGRMRLRHLIESGEILGGGELDRLEEEKSAFITLIDKLLNPIVP